MTSTHIVSIWNVTEPVMVIWLLVFISMWPSFCMVYIICSLNTGQYDCTRKKHSMIVLIRDFHTGHFSDLTESVLKLERGKEKYEWMNAAIFPYFNGMCVYILRINTPFLICEPNVPYFHRTRKWQYVSGN